MQPKQGHMQARIENIHKKTSRRSTYTIKETNHIERKELAKRIILAVSNLQIDE